MVSFVVILPFLKKKWNVKAANLTMALIKSNKIESRNIDDDCFLTVLNRFFSISRLKCCAIPLFGQNGLIFDEIDLQNSPHTVFIRAVQR